MSSPSPLRGAASGFVLLALFLLLWEAFICLLGLACLYLLACRFKRWVQYSPALHRFLAACVLLVCHPRPIDGRLYEFCHSQE